MKTKKHIQILLLLILPVILLTGCQTDKKFIIKMLDNPAFVRNTANLLNVHVEKKEYLYSGSNPLIDLEGEPVFEPFFYFKDLKTTADPEDKSIIHYSCKIPGLVGISYNIVFGKCFLDNEKYSPWVEVEGELKIVMDEKGNRMIDISDPDDFNVFTLWAYLRYTASSVYKGAYPFQKEGKPIPEGISEKDIAKGLPYIPVLCNKLFRDAYASLTGISPVDYTKTVIAPEMKYYTEHFSEFSKKSNKTGYGLINQHNALPWFLMIPLDLVLLIIFLIVGLFVFMKIADLIIPSENRSGLRMKWQKRINGMDKAEKKRLSGKKYKKILANSKFTDYKNVERDGAIRALTYPEDREMLCFLAEEELNVSALERLPYPEERELLVRILRRVQDDMKLRVQCSDVEMVIIAKLQYPADKEVLEREAKYGNLAKVRTAALNKLQYPESKEIIEHLAASDPMTDVRLAAIDKISGSDAIGTIEKAILSDSAYQEYRQLRDSKGYGKEFEKAEKKMKEGEKCCLALLEKLTYPEAKSAIANIARNSDYWDVRGNALEKLQYPADREVIMDCLLHQSYHMTPTYNTIDKMLYPEAREDLIELAKNAQSYDAKRRAIRQLPYPEEKEIITFLLENDKDGSLSETIMETIERSKEGKEMLSETALKAGDAKTRLDALKKLDITEYRKVFQQAAQKDKEVENRRYAIDKLEYPEDRKALAKAAQNDEDRENRFLARRKLPFLEEPSGWAHEDLLGDGKSRYLNEKLNPTEAEKVKAVIALTLSPRDNDETLRGLCGLIQKGMKGDSKGLELTLAGWAAAALGKVLTSEMTPDDIEPNHKRFEKAIDQYNEVVRKIQALKNNLITFIGFDTRYLSDSQKKDYEKIKSLQEELDRGLGNYMLDNGDKPFTYLTHILRDNQSRVPRFIKQGVIMGLLDWLMENKEQPEAQKLLEDVIAVRADLIRADNELSFFEVRVPADCTRDEYAQILSMVLRSANPSIKYCSTKNLLALAEEEVPGCMKMLQKYPLRLIDPVNKRTLGFYQFKPYIHEMWTQYQPPINTGKVISRYHEVDDRTLPLSSGLNLQLFRDTYSVIPTLFHEYQHFSGDPNEASVFLKTQIFSIGFYRRHKTAKASRDTVFAKLTELMGMPPEASKCSELNALIEQYYGKEVTPAEAVEHANAEIKKLNDMIYTINVRQTWDPSVTFPQLTDNEDKKDRDLIRDIIIRWDKTPKSITAAEFRSITAGVVITEEEDEEPRHRPD